MTISSQTVKQVFTGNGVTTTFAIPFQYDATSEVKVYLRDNSVEPATITLKTISTHYTIVGANVEMITAPAATEELIILRDTANTQTWDALLTAQLNQTTLESELDRIVKMVQEHEEVFTRVPTLPLGEKTNIVFPEPGTSDGGFIKWNTAGTALETSDAITDQDLYTTDDVTFASVIVTDLTASRPVKTNGSKELVSGQIDLTSSNEVSGALPIANGGTGQTSQTAAMDALSPTTTKGDLLVDNGTNVIRVAVGTDGQVLKANSGTASGVEWGAESVDLTSEVTGALPIANGGTGETAQTAAFDALSPLTTLGDILAHDGTNNIRVAVGTDGQVLVADSAEPSGVKWDTNTPVTPLTTKGDLYTYDTGDQRLPVGTDGQVLVANSAETTGLEWVDVPENTEITSLDDTDSPVTVADADSSRIYSFDTSAGAVSVALPAVAGVLGRKYTFILNVAGNDLTISGDGAETINGEASQVIDQQYTALTLLALSSGWVIV
jgi:sulfur carrier protein ThiS